MHWLKTHRYHLFAASILLLLWLRAEWRLWRLDSEMDRAYLKEVTIQAMDAETMKPLPLVLRSSGKGIGQRWPKDFRVTTTDDLSELRVRWIDIASVDVGVTAEGYQEQRLHLSQQSENRIVVSLRRDLPP